MDIPNLITYLTECISAASINKFCICDLITVYVSKYKYMYLETTFYFLCRYIHVILTLESSNFVKIVSNFLQCFFFLFFSLINRLCLSLPHLFLVFSSLSSLTNNITNSKKQCIVPDKIILIRYEIIKK